MLAKDQREGRRLPGHDHSAAEHEPQNTRHTPTTNMPTLNAAGLELSQLTVDRPSLEDVYLGLTGTAAAEDPVERSDR